MLVPPVIIVANAGATLVIICAYFSKITIAFTQGAFIIRLAAASNALGGTSERQ